MDKSFLKKYFMFNFSKKATFPLFVENGMCTEALRGNAKTVKTLSIFSRP